MDKLAVEVKGVNKTFHSLDSSVHALKNVNFHANFGELSMIVGPSGCGKTTLLSVIAGVLNADDGEIEVLNININHLNDKNRTEFRKKNVGYIFQNYRLIPTLTALENISIPLLLNGATKKIAEEKGAYYLHLVGLEGRGEAFPYHLSGGQQQRIAIARALIHEPPLLICDEPTAALDATSGAQILDLLVNIARSPGRALIMVTHDERIFQFADRIIKMNDGSIENNQGLKQ